MRNLESEDETIVRASDSAASSWKLTRVAQILGIEYPIIQAPFGGFPSQQLAATVSNLGGLGSLGAVTLGGSPIKEAIDEIRGLTAMPFAINLWVSTSDQAASRVGPEAIEQVIEEFAHFYAELGIERPRGVEAKLPDFEAQVAAAIDAHVPMLSFIFGVPPKEVLAECRRQGIKTIGTATTPEEAIALEQAGLDLIVASGFEGGGHRGSFLRAAKDSLVGSVSLVPQIVDAVSIPVIAAGGIADARGIAAALALGAEGAQIGTAFLACEGSGASKSHAKALVSKPAKRTALTATFTGRLARGVKNRLMDELESRSDSVLPFPLQYLAVGTVVNPATERGNTELATLWAGQSVGLCRFTDAAELMGELISGTDAHFSKYASRGSPRNQLLETEGPSTLLHCLFY